MWFNLYTRGLIWDKFVIDKMVMDEETNVFKFLLSKTHDNDDNNGPIGGGEKEILAKAVAEITTDPTHVLEDLFELSVTSKKGVHCNPIKRPKGLYYVDQLVNLWRYFYDYIDDKNDINVETGAFVILGSLMGHIIDNKIMRSRLYWFNGYDSRKVLTLYKHVISTVKDLSDEKQVFNALGEPQDFVKQYKFCFKNIKDFEM